MSWDELVAMPAPAPGIRIAYGPSASQFGELRVPTSAGRHPVAVVIHGGCWRSPIDLSHVAHLCAAIAASGVATWALEYRRVGEPGGGWPGTFEDIALGVSFVTTLASRFPLDPDRVVLLGHSAGAQLALWLAAGRGLGAGASAGAGAYGAPVAAMPAIRGVVAVSGILDLATYSRARGFCPDSVAMLLGGGPDAVPERYACVSPVELLPIETPMRLVHGASDDIVPVEQSGSFAARARVAGDDVAIEFVDGAGHFDPVVPGTAACARVEAAVRERLRA